MTTGKKNLVFFSLFSLTALFVSCGPKEADKIGDAQLCIDKAAQGSANACMEKIDGVETPAAYALRCSANFIDEGFTKPARFQQAFGAFDNNSTNNTEAFMSVLAFSSKSTLAEDVTFANQTYDYCQKSQAKGLMLLGTMASTATTLQKVASDLGALIDPTHPLTDTDIHNALTDLQSNPTAGSNPQTISAIGTVVSTTYASSCGTNDANKSICDQLNEALTGVDMSDPAAVGAAVIAKWSN